MKLLHYKNISMGMHLLIKCHLNSWINYDTAKTSQIINFFLQINKQGNIGNHLKVPIKNPLILLTKLKIEKKNMKLNKKWFVYKKHRSQNEDDLWYRVAKMPSLYLFCRGVSYIRWLIYPLDPRSFHFLKFNVKWFQYYWTLVHVHFPLRVILEIN